LIRVKICGVNDAASFDAAMACGADWIGFVFYRQSPRFITPATAAGLSARAQGGAQRVGLFVSPDDEAIAATLAAVRLDVLQLYDTPDRVAAVAARFGVPVWRAVGVTGTNDLPADAGAAAALLVEPRAPAGATRPGGNATSLDPMILRGWRPAFPWLLAGGLTPANVADSIAASGASAVDVSSGVESLLGVKSPALIAAFVSAARKKEDFNADKKG
jgi:phosphoribosylanthranilate isomerase